MDTLKEKKDRPLKPIGETIEEFRVKSKKETFAITNGLAVDDPILDKFNEETGEIELTEQQKIILAKGLYKPISFTLQVNGQTTVIQTSNVLKVLKEIDIVPTTIKTVSVLHFEFKGNVYHRIFRVQQMKMLLGNESRKIMVAKVINMTLGLQGEELYK